MTAEAAAIGGVAVGNVTEDAGASLANTLGRLLGAIAKGNKVPPPAPTPAPQHTGAAALPAPLPPLNTTALERELQSLDAPALRTLVIALSTRLAVFADANARNASVTAERVTALTLALAGARGERG